MIFFSRKEVDKCNPHEIIPISFGLQEELQEKYHIHTRSGTHKAGNTVEKVYGHDKPLIPHITPE